MSLSEAVSSLVHDGDTIALEGFTHLIPFAAGQEIIRQGRRDLTLVRMTPDVLYDQMIGSGCARKLIFSWGGNPGVGSLHRFRDAVERDWPRPLELEEHSHAGMAARYVAGASGLPFGVLRGYTGTSFAQYTDTIAEIACSIVTVEEIVDVLDSRVTVTLPSWVVSAIAVVPGGAHPSYAHGYSERDNDFYVTWEEISRDRESFDAWMQANIHGAVVTG